MENEKNLNELPEEAAPVEETVPVEEAAPAEEGTPVEETAAEEAPAEESKPEGKKVTPGKMALMIAAIVAVLALIIALIVGGKEAPVQESVPTEPAATEQTEPTIPTDGNPDDETCKGTYTVTDEEVKAAAGTVVATVDGHELTNGQLQAFYWMQVQNFLSSEYGNYIMYYGLLNPAQSLDTQTCALAEYGTWQQFFLKEALNTWRNYAVLYDEAVKAGMELAPEDQEFLDNLEQMLQDNATYYGLESVEELLSYNVGAGATVDDYHYFQELLMKGNLYYDAEYAKLTPTLEEMEAYFAEHEDELKEQEITKEGNVVDVRHILLVPEGGTTDENGNVTYSDAEWEACKEKAEGIMNIFTGGEATEEEFAILAVANSQDPGSQGNGGLYEDVHEGEMVPEFNDWCFDEKRQPGHNGIVKTTYGYHLMYFVGREPIWQNYTSQVILVEKARAMMDELAEKHPMEASYADMVLGHVNLAG